MCVKDFNMCKQQFSKAGLKKRTKLLCSQNLNAEWKNSVMPETLSITLHPILFSLARKYHKDTKL